MVSCAPGCFSSCMKKLTAFRGCRKGIEYSGEYDSHHGGVPTFKWEGDTADRLRRESAVRFVSGRVDVSLLRKAKLGVRRAVPYRVLVVCAHVPCGDDVVRYRAVGYVFFISSKRPPALSQIRSMISARCFSHQKYQCRTRS